MLSLSLSLSLSLGPDDNIQADISLPYLTSEIRLSELYGNGTWGNYKCDGITLIRAL